MKQFFKWLGKHIAGALVFSLFSILFIAGIVYAITYPSTPPAGEVTGGKFMLYFNKMLVNTGASTDGTVNRAVLSDTTSQIGTLTEEKWCKVVSGKVVCLADVPGGGIISSSNYINTFRNLTTTTKSFSFSWYEPGNCTTNCCLNTANIYVTTNSNAIPTLHGITNTNMISKTEISLWSAGATIIMSPSNGSCWWGGKFLPWL